MVKIYSDGADLEQMRAIYDRVDGYTTNPTLMRKAGVTDYEHFAKAALEIIDKPISFEVFSDDFDDMERQARIISGWGKNVYVKIPITNTKGHSSEYLIKELSKSGVKVNVTAVFTREQIRGICTVLNAAPAIVSIFAGRMADTGVDPMTLCRQAKSLLLMNVEVLWASTRELLNIKQAEEAGCDIITVSPDLLKKLDLFGKDLTQYSLETVQMFYNDAKAAGYQL